MTHFNPGNPQEFLERTAIVSGSLLARMYTGSPEVHAVLIGLNQKNMPGDENHVRRLADQILTDTEHIGYRVSEEWLTASPGIRRRMSWIKSF